MLARLMPRAAALGRRAVEAARARIVREAVLPADVTLSAEETGVVLSGRKLRRRRVDDPRLGNFGQ